MTWEYRRLKGVLGVTRFYKGFPEIRGGYKGFQEVTGGEERLQGVTEDCRKLFSNYNVPRYVFLFYFA